MGPIGHQGTQEEPGAETMMKIKRLRDWSDDMLWIVLGVGLSVTMALVVWLWT